MANVIYVRGLPWLRCSQAPVAAPPDVIKNTVGFDVPVPMLDALPYILTVIVLAGFVGRAIPPRAGGEPYVKER